MAGRRFQGGHACCRDRAEGIGLDDLSKLGPNTLLKVKFSPVDLMAAATS